MPTHHSHTHWRAPQANATTTALQRECLFLCMYEKKDITIAQQTVLQKQQ